MLKHYRQTVIVSFDSRESMDPSHIEHFVNAAIKCEVPRYMPDDPLGRIDRGSVRVLAVSEEPKDVRPPSHRT